MDSDLKKQGETSQSGMREVYIGAASDGFLQGIKLYSDRGLFINSYRTRFILSNPEMVTILKDASRIYRCPHGTKASEYRRPPRLEVMHFEILLGKAPLSEEDAIDCLERAEYKIKNPAGKIRRFKTSSRHPQDYRNKILL